MQNINVAKRSLIVSFILIFTISIVWSDTDGSKDQQIKAAFLYNFLKFTDWPEDKIKDNNEPIIIGILGPDSFNEAFGPVKGKPVKGKHIEVRILRFSEKEIESGQKLEEFLEQLRMCHLVFFYDTLNEKNVGLIFDNLKNSGALTVGQQNGFVDQGGNVNFLIEEGKLRFEVNLISVKNNNLKVSTDMLKLAKRVIRENK